MLLLTVEHEANRGSGLARKRGRNHAWIARTKLGAETAAHVLGNDAHLGFGNLEVAGKFFADAGGPLGGGIHGEQIGLPVSDHAVGLERGVGLHLGGVAGIHDHVGVLESLFGIALFAHRRSVDISRLGDAAFAPSSARSSSLIGRTGKDEGCIGFASQVGIYNERQRFILHFDLCRSLLGRLGRDSGYSGDRLSSVANDGQLRALQRRIAQHGIAKNLLAKAGGSVA